MSEIGTAFYGQDAVVRGVLVGMLTRGNVLLEGQPGLGKTLLVKVLAQALSLDFSRIQFTPDLMPADITGTEALIRDENGATDLRFRAGPLFAHIVLADEINRATPKTQSALLEAMQEHAVTVSGRRRVLEEPFCVIATQNPVEMEGTYPLPEAQLDRFLLKLDVPFPPRDVLVGIGLRTTGDEVPSISPVVNREEMLGLQRLVRRIVLAPEVAEYAANLVMATHPDQPDAPPAVRRFCRYGASPRAMQALILAGRAEALLAGRPWVAAEDLTKTAHAILGHRLILNFEAELEGTRAADLVDAVLKVARPVASAA